MRVGMKLEINGAAEQEVMDSTQSMLDRATEFWEADETFIALELLGGEDVSHLSKSAGIILGILMASGDIADKDDGPVRSMLEAAEVLLHISDSWHKEIKPEDSNE